MCKQVTAQVSQALCRNYLAQVFPGAAAPVFADWFGGELRYLSLKFYAGKLVSECEALQATSVIQVKHGCIVAGAQAGKR